MAKEITHHYKKLHLSLTKEQSEMMNFLKDHYQESGANIAKKAIERLYYTIKDEKNEKS